MVTCNSEIDLPDAVNVVSSANILADEYCLANHLYRLGIEAVQESILEGLRK